MRPLSRTALTLATAFALAAVVGCGTRGGSEAGPEVQVVSRFLEAMLRNDSTVMKKLISPTWLSDRGINIRDHTVNRFAAAKYEIESVEGNEVTATVDFLPVKNRLVFRVVEENGSHYIWPGELKDNGWIDPWLSVQKYAQ